MHTMQSVKGCNLPCKDTLFIILLKKIILFSFFLSIKLYLCIVMWKLQGRTLCLEPIFEIKQEEHLGFLADTFGLKRKGA